MAEVFDNRDVRNGWEIPTRTYSDQPYVVKTDDGAWLCTMTTGSGHEGKPGQHVVSSRSTDGGRSWSDLVEVEPADGPEASYAVLLKVPGGRIYCFYNHNTEDRRWIIADDPPYEGGRCYRVDSQGYFVFRYSDDHGRSWSSERFPLPMRQMAIDRENPYGGEVLFFWNVGKPIVHDGSAFVSLHKVGGIGNGFFTRSEGVLLKSDNILTEADPARIRWETLPDGDAGLRSPPGGGPIAEEHSYSVLSDGSFYSIYRTTDGHPASAYSRDGGHSWSEPQYERFADGRLIKHPRAANFAWRCENGKFLYWFHNHGGNWYEDRNPVWLCGGVEVDTPEGRVIRWSQPEIALYDDDTYIRMSYPDLIEEGGDIYLFETQKDFARVHKLDRSLTAGLWGQFEAQGSGAAEVVRDGCLLELTDPSGEIELPQLPEFTRRDSERADHGVLDLRGGLTVELWLELADLEAGQILLDSRADNGQGLCLQTTARGTVEIILNDGRTENRWDCDPGVLRAGERQHLVAIVDGGPKLITFLVDGAVCDGGAFRQFGWGRFNPNLRHVNSETVNWSVSPGAVGTEVSPNTSIGELPGRAVVAEDLRGRVQRLRIFDRALRTSEAIANFNAER
jgi:hypothetical protein